MTSAKTMFGGLVAGMVMAALATAPASAGTFVSVTVDGQDVYFSSTPSYSYYSYTSSRPAYSSSYHEVSYERTGSYETGAGFYGSGYNDDEPVYYSRSLRVYSSEPDEVIYSSRVYYSSSW
jgi:hypothetical protein